MKNLKKIFLGIFIFGFAFHFQLFAQQEDNNTIAINKYFSNNKAANIQKSVQNKVFKAQYLSNTLTQVGNYNYSLIQTNSKSSHNVMQKGNKNEIKLLSYYNGNNYINLISNQVGNNNSIHIIGTNSIAKKLKITQKSNNSTIFIRNYN